MKASGYDRRNHPFAEVKISAFGTPRIGAAATFAGNYDTANPVFKTAPALGADARWLQPQFTREAVASDETSVSTIQQTSRT